MDAEGCRGALARRVVDANVAVADRQHEDGASQNQTLLVDIGAKDDKIDMLCIGAAALPPGVKPGDTVTATGRLQSYFGKPALEDCTVAKK